MSCEVVLQVSLSFSPSLLSPLPLNLFLSLQNKQIDKYLRKNYHINVKICDNSLTNWYKSLCHMNKNNRFQY